MAISRHDPEWKHTIATAYLAGVRFVQILPFPSNYSGHIWMARVPVGLAELHITSHSKIGVARKALVYIEKHGAPDAAFVKPSN